MSLFQLFVSIFCTKSLFCKHLQELSLVVLQILQKIAFLSKRIFTTIWGYIIGLQLFVFQLTANSAFLTLKHFKNEIRQISFIRVLTIRFKCQIINNFFTISTNVEKLIALAFQNQKFKTTPINLKPSFASSQPAFMFKNISYLIILLSIGATSFSFAQLENKKKIGLVLSGGGAKGLAHIGVLKVIEEHGIKIDYIGGTSMGAVIGGLYAAGYNASQIDSLFHKTDFDKLMSDFVQRTSKNFYEKQNDERYAITLPYSKLKFSVPTSFSKGIYMYGMLSRLTDNAKYITDFNKLKTPFLCMATNIETGEQVIINKGYLPQAMMASATFPTLFSPIEIDGKLLIDGGVANNYPILEVKDLGAEIIIGVDVQDGLKSRDKLQDATKILVQIANLQMIEKMKKKRLLTDVYIKPDVSKYSVISFADGDSISNVGFTVAQKMSDQLKLLGIGYKKPKLAISQIADSLIVDYITINELENYTRSYVIGKLQFDAGDKISYEDLKIGVDNINATQNFSSINYTIEDNNGKLNLRFNLIEKSIKTFVKAGIHYDQLYKSGLLLNITKKNLFVKNDVVSLDIIVGDNFRYNFDYYIDNGFYWSFGLKSRYNQFNLNIDTQNVSSVLGAALPNSINVGFSDFSNSIYMQTAFKQKFIIGTGLEHKQINAKAFTLQSFLPEQDASNYLNLFGYLKYDSLDNVYFPTKGWNLSCEIQSYFYGKQPISMIRDFVPYSLFKAEFGYAQKFLKKATIMFQADGGFTTRNQTVGFFDFFLGGYGFNRINNIKNFYGYDFLALNGNSYLKAGATVDIAVYKKNHLNFTANYANMGDRIFQGTNWFNQPRYSGYALGYGLESIIGPIEIKYSWSPEVKINYLWFAVGFRF